jgi:hypothetical protein
MSLRLKTKWHNKNKDRSLTEIAQALGFMIWRIAANGLLELENEGFVTYSNAHRLEIMAEFLAFLLHAADRLAHDDHGMDDDSRRELITALALHLATNYAENQTDLFGSGDYKKSFIEHLNQRGEEYAERSFSDGEARLDFLRHFGDSVALILGEKNRQWASQHIIELDAPQALKPLRKAMRDLLAEE